jgi:ADP-heptose:LPS heptosyltransferase
MGTAKNIYFQPWGGLGDVLLSTPALEAISKRYPEARIYCKDTPINRELLAYNPHIYQFIASHRELLKTPDDQLKNITNNLEREEAVFFPCYGKLRPSRLDNPVHAISLICQMLGLTPPEHRVRIYFSAEEKAQAKAMAGDIGQPFVAFHAQATCARNKEWYPECWAQVITWLNNKGYRVIQLGGDGELPIPGVISLLGRPIRQSLSLLEQAQYFLGIESVFNHAAHSFGIPGVVLFGASTPTVWGYAESINIYKNLPCQPCLDLLHDSCKVRRCMQLITPDEVIHALSLLID